MTISIPPNFFLPLVEPRGGALQRMSIAPAMMKLHRIHPGDALPATTIQDVACSVRLGRPLMSLEVLRTVKAHRGPSRRRTLFTYKPGHRFELGYGLGLSLGFACPSSSGAFSFLSI